MKAAVILKSMICCQRSSGIVSAGATHALPALLTKTSTLPNLGSVAAFTASSWSGLVTSAASPSALTPSFSMPAAACSQFASLREQMTTFDPASARPVAICRPRPVAPPVTTLTLPWRLNSSFTLAISLSSSRIFQQLRGDDVALDLRAALVDAGDARVAVCRLDPRLAHVAHAAVDLHRAVRDLGQRFRREKLRSRRFQRAALAALHRFDRTPGQQPRGVPRDAHVGEHPLQALVLGDFLPALHACL